MSPPHVRRKFWNAAGITIYILGLNALLLLILLLLGAIPYAHST